MDAPPVSFQLISTDGAARRGQITTPHGSAQTPLFMPVATQATVKGLTFDEVKSLGAETVLSNAYHLYLRPGVQRVHDAGGLHRFMGWNGPILTDSGGYQAFSMGSLRRIDDSGIIFQSHIDGSRHFFTPQSAIANQHGIGADIIMCFDQCVFSAGDPESVRDAMDRTHRWAKEVSRIPRRRTPTPKGRPYSASSRAVPCRRCAPSPPTTSPVSPSTATPSAAWPSAKLNPKCTP